MQNRCLFTSGLRPLVLTVYYDMSYCTHVMLLLCCLTAEDSGESQSESDNSVSDSIEDNDDSVAEISRSFRSRQELCEQLNVNQDRKSVV